mmetsp:Transcript_122609/g.347631  ORF Transcript_122609/g.347631 Transcript_122609/m.347631 type:complete len:235 (-) Transcript_122609:76-780(-)
MAPPAASPAPPAPKLLLTFTGGRRFTDLTLNRPREQARLPRHGSDASAPPDSAAGLPLHQIGFGRRKTDLTLGFEHPDAIISGIGNNLRTIRKRNYYLQRTSTHGGPDATPADRQDSESEFRRSANAPRSGKQQADRDVDSAARSYPSSVASGTEDAWSSSVGRGLRSSAASRRSATSLRSGGALRPVSSAPSLRASDDSGEEGPDTSLMGQARHGMMSTWADERAKFRVSRGF